MNKRKILVPEYFLKFKCIGSNCEDTCCIGWKVDIDRKTYKRYKKCADFEMKNKLNKNVIRNRNQASDERYAKIKLDDYAVCPFLNAEKLCEIQLKIGEQYLSNVCSAYPKVSNIINGVYEKSCFMSCPEIVRLALLNPEGISFIETEEDENIRNIVDVVYDKRNYESTLDAKKYFEEIRTLIIQLLKTREYELWERLTIIGLLCDKLQKCIDDKEINKIPELINTFTSLTIDGTFKETLESIPTNINIQMELIKEIADQRIIKGVWNSRFLRCFDECLEGIQYNDEFTVEAIGQRYLEAYDKYYVSFMKKYDYILENYLVNHVFRRMFPFDMRGNIFDSYCLLVIYYSLIKLLIIGISAYKKEELKTDDIITLVQSFSKAVEHDGKFINDIIEMMKVNKFLNMSYMVILLKN